MQRERRGWRLATVAGIDLRIHPSFLVLVGLVLVGAFGPPAAGGVWIALLFGSVVVHELAHSVIARGRGLTVRGIVLLPIGGVSEIGRMPDRPRDELAVALAGPLTSFALAAAAAGVLAAAGSAILPVDLLHGPLLHRLLWANVFLGAFNLLPAFPLDGGRVYRAALARRVGLERATRSAARLGRRAAAVMAVIGVLADPWLLLIALFVYVGSRAEETATLVHLRLAPRRVGDAMVPLGSGLTIPDVIAPVDLDVRAPLEDAVQALVDQRATGAAVRDATGRLVGVLHLDDVVHLLQVPPPQPPRSVP